MTKTFLILMASAILWTTTTASAAEPAGSCDAAGLKVSAESLSPMDRDALHQRIEMLEAQGRKLRGLVEQRLLPAPDAVNGAPVQAALSEELRTTENTIHCLEEVENASMEARLELLRKYLDSVRANAR